MNSFQDSERRRYPAGWRWLVVATIASLLLSLLPVLAPVALAADFTVDVTVTDDTSNTCAVDGATQPCSLRDAIRFANSKTSADTTTINLPAGTYTLSQGGDDNNATLGDLDITQKVILLGPVGESGATINAAGIDRIFDVRSGGGLTIGTSVALPSRLVTLTGGRTTNTFTGGTTGGAIRVNSGAGVVELNDTTVTGNQAPVAFLGVGGGISAEGGNTLTLRRSTVSNNNAVSNGGGLYVAGVGVLLTVEESTFQGNSTAGVGGGIFFNGNNTGSTIAGTTIVGNSASSVGGGGIWDEGSGLLITNSTIAQNTVLGGTAAGAIHLEGSGNLLTLRNSTVAENSSGIRRSGGTFTVGNSIIANSANGANCVGTITDGNYNIDSGATCAFGAPNSLSNTNPLLGSLEDNLPGRTTTMALGQASPAVDLIPGSDATCTGTDQRGVPRPQDGGAPSAANCDAGAYELLPDPTITSITPTSGSTSGGQGVTITGTGFQSGVAVNLCANAITAPFVSGGTDINGLGVIDGTTITCDTDPSDAGPVDVIVTNEDGGTATLAAGYTFVAPTVTAIAPASGPNGGGTAVTITGTLFDSNATVTIGGNLCLNTVVNSDTEITCDTPAGAVGTADVVVTNPDATAGGGVGTLAGGFTYLSTQVQLSPTTLTFANQLVGTTSLTKEIILTNSGPAPLTITSVAIGGTNAGDFVLTNVNCTGTIVPSASCTMQVAFAPTAGDLRVATLTVTDDDGGIPGSTQSVPLSGSGLLFGSFTIDASANAGGAVSPPGVTVYTAGSVAGYTATPDAGQLFLGWTLDGAFVGHANPLTITVNADHTLSARFAPRQTFPDVAPGSATAEAIAQLTARGIIIGYQDGTFGPDDGTLRAQMAALIARGMPSNAASAPGVGPQTWAQVDHGNPFTDGGGIDPNLWRNVGTLAFYNVALGYGDGRFGPNDQVTYAQTISFITRAMVAKGYWTMQPDNGTVYPNVPQSSGHRQDLATYAFYAGPVFGTTATTENFAGWEQPSSRAFFAHSLWQAIDSYWSVDRVP